MQQQILLELRDNKVVDSAQLQIKYKVSTAQLDAHLKSLLVNNYIVLESYKINKWVLTKQGQIYSKEGTPEFQLFSKVPTGGIPRKQLQELLKDSYKIGFTNCMKKKIIQIKDDRITRLVQNFEDLDCVRLNIIKEGIKIGQIKKQDLSTLKSRKLIEQKSINHYKITRGTQYKEKKVTLLPQLTSEIITKEQWQKYDFKKFNISALGVQIENGNLHPLMKTRTQFRQILLELGFQQMKTNKYVESSFWNFDSLFQPQAHPARDAHDTFFISDPQNCRIEDEKYWQQVKNIHEKGGYGSIGYDCNWQYKEGKKNILRTHTTAVSSRTLYELAKKKDYRPRKFFSIDRVFRNQSLDATHLAEFHQIQGFVIDRNLGLPHLIGIITQFYKKIGIQKIWLKPTYNPYTQPSMEIYGYHPILKKKVEIGNSGIFRPEMLRPMGFPEDISVIAWGLGLQRPTMIQFGISNIKDLFGPGVSLKKLKQSGIFCLSN